MTHEAGQPDEEGQGGFLAGNHKDIIQVQSKGEASHLCEDVRTVGHDAGQPDKGGCGGILAGKQEVHDSVGHSCVCGVLRMRQPSRICFCDLLEAALRPEIHQAAWLGTALQDRHSSQTALGPHISANKSTTVSAMAVFCAVLRVGVRLPFSICFCNSLKAALSPEVHQAAWLSTALHEIDATLLCLGGKSSRMLSNFMLPI